MLAGADGSEVLMSRGVVNKRGVTDTLGEATRGAGASDVEQAINIISACLKYNKLSPANGYDAFDSDEDGKVSFADMRMASSVLDLGIGEDVLEKVYNQMDPEGEGHISREAWYAALAGANAEEVLQSRGIQLEYPANTRGNEESTEAGGAATVSERSRISISTIAAVIQFNNLSVEDAYFAFDVDGDGR
eukprot:624882-Hanusia_phi.AAC.1